MIQTNVVLIKQNCDFSDRNSPWLNQSKMALLSLPSLPKLFSSTSIPISVFSGLIITHTSGSQPSMTDNFLPLLQRGEGDIYMRKPPKIMQNYVFGDIINTCWWHLTLLMFSQDPLIFWSRLPSSFLFQEWRWSCNTTLLRFVTCKVQ